MSNLPVALDMQTKNASIGDARLLPDIIDSPMPSRLVSAVMRLDDSVSQDVPHSTRELRPIQACVFEDVSDFVRNSLVNEDGATPYGRIILPPRTGKTVIAGQLIARTGLTTTFITNTLTLVEQAYRSLREQLPDVLIGRFTGEREEIVPYGVNITTYEMMNRRWKSGVIPQAIRSSALVIADEAHHALTDCRLDYLRSAFDPQSLRLALTATPNYDAHKALGRFFPALVHELSLQEAISLELLAPLRVWVAEVDVDGSVVTLKQGDYHEETLGRIMSAAPFFKAVETFRYDEQNRHTPCLITCSSRQQAYDLSKYLNAHHPRHAPPPKLILGDTSDRERILEFFDKNVIDTLISVNVLVEGWDAPSCKLLIDLAPSLSVVKATQKFCRVLTRDEDKEARIFMILPRNLIRSPVMPMELLVPDLEGYDAGDLLDARSAKRKATELSKLKHHPRTHPVEDVELKSRILLVHRVEKPLLNPKDDVRIRSVFGSNPLFSPLYPCKFSGFRNLFFRHALFTGRADHLLRHLGYRPSSASYMQMLARLFPSGAANVILAEKNPSGDDCENDRRTLIEATLSGLPSNDTEKRRFQEIWRAVGGLSVTDENPEDDLDQLQMITALRHLLGSWLVDDPRLKVLLLHYGFEGEEQNLTEIADNALYLPPDEVRKLHREALILIEKALLSMV